MFEIVYGVLLWKKWEDFIFIFNGFKLNIDFWVVLIVFIWKFVLCVKWSNNEIGVFFNFLNLYYDSCSFINSWLGNRFE